MATSVGTLKLRTIVTSSHQNPPKLCTNRPHRLSLASPSSALSSLHTLRLTSPLLPHSLRRGFSVRADLSVNGASQHRFDFDLFVIGAGTCGFSASQLATSYGASVAVCELPFDPISSDSARGVGGTCVPKKLLLYGSKFSHEYKGSYGFGWSFEDKPKNNRSNLIANKNTEIQRLTGVYKNMLKNAGAVLIEGRGKVIDAHTVDVDGKHYSARNILISVGGQPFIPDIPGKEYAIDSDAALNLSEKPKRLAVIGGGYEALEIASIFKGLTTTVVEVFIPQDKALRGFDEEVGDFLGEQMSLRDITFHTEESPQAILKSADGTLSLKTNKGTIDGFEQIMFATGRKPNTQNLGLEQAGVKMNKNGAIEVDEYSHTSVPSIWAVGDVTDRMNLTPVALMEGMALTKTLFTNEPTKPDYRAVPSAVFTQPPLGQVGLTEEQAIEKYGDIDVFTANFRPLKATLSGQPDRVLMKMIVCEKTDKVIGLHMCGEDAPEIIQGFAVAVKAGLTKADFDATIGIHPTAAEEFVAMKTPTRKIRSLPEANKVPQVMMKATAGVGV